MNIQTPVLRPFVNAETVTLAEYLTDRVSENLGRVPAQQEFISWLNDFVNTTTLPIAELSTTRPSFEALKQQFHAKLSQRDAWRDIIQAGGGETLLEFIATVGSLGQGGLVTAQQENNTDGAVLTSSIYVLMRMLGVHIRRKIPSQVPVQLTNLNLEYRYIPRYSQFNISGVGYFNREAIVIETGVATKDVILYQGAVTMESYTSNGSPYQRFELGSSSFDVADLDLFCYLPNGQEWVRVEDGLWKYSASTQVFYENTTPEGNVEIVFGNNVYGKIPPAGSALQFLYVRTAGDVVNSSETSRNVQLVALNTWVPDRVRGVNDSETTQITTETMGNIGGTTTGPVTGGEQERDGEHYRAVGPFLAAGKRGMINRNQHYAVGMEYPGVVDILFQGQREIGRYNRNLINVVWVTPLMKGGRSMTNTEWEDFLRYMEKRTVWRQDYVHKPPTPVYFTIQANIYCERDTSPQAVESYAQYNLLQNFGIRRGSLGYSPVLDDIYDSLKLNYDKLRVDYVDLFTPKDVIPVGPMEYAVLENPTLNAYQTTRKYKGFVPPITDIITS